MVEFGELMLSEWIIIGRVYFVVFYLIDCWGWDRLRNWLLCG
jgi:hypothetical protein